MLLVILPVWLVVCANTKYMSSSGPVDQLKVALGSLGLKKS
jgi:hypothetical protein